MKHIFPLLILACFATDSFAQIQKSDLFLSGTGSFVSEGEKPSRSTALTITPAAGFLITDRLAIGGAFNITSLSFNSNDFRSSILGVSPFLRYYLSSTGKFCPFIQGFGGFQLLLNKEFDDPYSSLNFGGNLGFDFFLRKNIALEMNLEYKLNRYLDTNNPLTFADTNTFSINFGVIGFLSKQKKAE